MFKSIKQKVLNSITVHPKLVTLGIGLGMTFAFSIAFALLTQPAEATRVIVTIGKPEIISRVPG